MSENGLSGRQSFLTAKFMSACRTHLVRFAIAGPSVSAISPMIFCAFLRGMLSTGR